MATRLGKPLFGLDSTSMVPISGHHSVGSSFAGRYLSREAWKVVTQAEVDEYRAAKLGLILFFEDGAGNALRGHSQGQQDAAFAIEQARSLGITTGAIYFTVDSDVAPDAVDAYFDGVKIVAGERSGIYGSKTVVDRQMDRGIKYGCQTLAWSGGEVSSKAHVYQYDINHTVAGVGVDYDRAFFADYGQVGYVAPPPPDPHHYRRFDRTRRALLGGKSEVEIVQRYDKLRATQTHLRHPHRQELKELRWLCSTAAKRIEVVAAVGSHPAWGSNEPGMGVFYRQWRHDQLVKRASGRRVNS